MQILTPSGAAYFWTTFKQTSTHRSGWAVDGDGQLNHFLLHLFQEKWMNAAAHRTTAYLTMIKTHRHIWM